MVSWTRRREDVGGLALNVRELTSDGPTLMLVHGLGASGAVWQGVGRLLHPALRLVAPDLRGHGASDKPATGYLPRDYASDVTTLLTLEPISPVALLGHSLGAVVAALVAAERPELVGKLVLVDPPFDPERPRDHIEAVARLRHEPPGALERYLQEREPGLGDLYARAIADLFRSAADGPFQAAQRSEPGFSSQAAVLHSISTPTLLIAADPTLDAALGEEAAHTVAASLPDGRLLTLPGARHAVHASHPRDFATAVLGFVRP
jgi:pimeloyl-ACP methyl ester carboxylesterase